MKRAAILILAAAVCAWALYAFVYTPYSCDRSITTLIGRTQLAEDAGVFDLPARARANLADLQRMEKPCRARTHLYMLEAQNENLLGRKEEAIATLRQALLVDRRPEIYIAIGTLLVELGRMDEAVDHFVTAGRFSPARVKYIASPEARRRVEERLQQIAARRPK